MVPELTADHPQRVEIYQEWLAHNVGHPYEQLVWYNLGVALSSIPDWPAARHAYSEALRLHPDFHAARINLGGILEQLGAKDEAVACWRQLVERLGQLTPDNLNYKNSALKQIGRVADATRVEAALQQSLELLPRQHDVMEHWISSRQQQCQWPVIAPFTNCPKKQLMTGFAPLSLAAYSDDPLLQLANARMYNKTEFKQPSKTFLDTHEPLRHLQATRRPRVGYLSSDLRMHAIGLLMVDLFELHDRERVELFFYYTGQPVDDPIHHRIRAVAEHWCDLAFLPDEEAAARIVADQIEILVDVNGYTHTARLKMLAMRPAPVIVNWLGYPGTMASPYHQYLIADGFIVPEGYEIFYSERVLRLPCYQPNDRRRAISSHRPSRRDVGLPEESMVFCCFNGVRKITAFTWEIWCRILHRVPESVMWLLYENDTARNRLLELATAQGIGSHRLVFAPMIANWDHLARYPLADLVLDSFPYGAHTTASDALWMGVPILTLSGLSFASRVCGSLVSSAGLAELVCHSPEEFEARAVELATNRALLQGFRQRLQAGRETCRLFDMPGLAKHLEGLFEQLREDFRQNRVPRPNLFNLENYQEIGIELDQEGVWCKSVDELVAAYTKQLSEKNRLRYMPGDGRLWS
ncbi:MAG: hypothetical protein HQL93_02120 [Magnetococcales bacterium]|nr:hypothetical protein [Magnetococcales bacterium]